jgi:hypothetical protein
MFLGAMQRIWQSSCLKPKFDRFRLRITTMQFGHPRDLRGTRLPLLRGLAHVSFAMAGEPGDLVGGVDEDVDKHGRGHLVRVSALC